MIEDNFFTRRAPAEIVLRILQCCDSARDVLALVSTCRGLYNARMTQLVVDAERRGELPPTGVSPRQYQDAPPTLTELRAALNIHRLSIALQGAFQRRMLRYPRRIKPWGPWAFHDLDGTVTPEKPDRMDRWTARVSQAIFRALIIGAALAGTYREPVLKAKAHPDPEIQELLSKECLDPRDMDEKLAFLMQFPICDLEFPIEAHEALFSPLVEWLLEDILADRESREAMAARFERGFGRAGYCQSRAQDPSSGHCPLTLLDGSGSNSSNSSNHSDAHHVCWELMKIFWVVEHVRPASWQTREVISRYPSRKDRDATAQPQPSPFTSAVVVLFGMWRAEELMLPARVAGNRDQLAAYPAVADTEDEGTTVSDMLNYAFTYSGRPNYFDEGRLEPQPVASLELKFFEYFLLRHLNVCFYTITFRDIRSDLMVREYRLFVDCITIFSEDDVEDSFAFPTWGMLTDADFLDGSEMLT
ncbi:hypothetical protein VTG60DRAFT_7369 [Thermothelomyces hinnuleus]